MENETESGSLVAELEQVAKHIATDAPAEHVRLWIHRAARSKNFRDARQVLIRAFEDWQRNADPKRAPTSRATADDGQAETVTDDTRSETPTEATTAAAAAVEPMDQAERERVFVKLIENAKATELERAEKLQRELGRPNTSRELERLIERMDGERHEPTEDDHRHYVAMLRQIVDDPQQVTAAELVDCAERVGANVERVRLDCDAIRIVDHLRGQMRHDWRTLDRKLVQARSDLKQFERETEAELKRRKKEIRRGTQRLHSLADAPNRLRRLAMSRPCLFTSDEGEPRLLCEGQ